LALISDLEKIAAISPPGKTGPGRPLNTDLYQLVHKLANYWRYATDKAFTQDWNGADPISAGAEFTQIVVSFIDPKSLAALPSMTERVVNERRRGIVMPWLSFPKTSTN
jgi:hypothetical protein